MKSWEFVWSYEADRPNKEEEVMIKEEEVMIEMRWPPKVASSAQVQAPNRALPIQMQAPTRWCSWKCVWLSNASGRISAC